MTVFPEGFRKRLVVAARGEVGQRESGTNGGSAVRKYQAATWLEPGSWPWCAAFVCWCMKEAIELSQRADPAAWRATLPRMAAVAQFVDWASDLRCCQVIERPTSAKAGDLVLFRFPRGNHIGIVISDSVSGQFGTVEGNTDASGGREGDGVYRRSRTFESVSHIIRFNEA
jgi:hypothetical protein